MEIVFIILIGAVGAFIEFVSRARSPVVPSQDATGTACEKLCAEVRSRWAAQCMAVAYETYMRVRWQQSAIAAALAVATVVGLTIAAQGAAASFFGFLAAVFLAAAAVVAEVFAVMAAGFSANALVGFNNASGAANGVRNAFNAAVNQMMTLCGPGETNACRASLPPCPP